MLNVVANYAGTIVNTVVPLIAIPFYVNLLSDRAWGLVSTIFLIQSVLYLSEAGISQISSIAFSRINLGEKKSIVVIKEYEAIYWTIAMVIWVIIILLSLLFAWLELLHKYTKLEFLIIAFGAAFIFLAQFPGAVYKSIMMNTERQVQYNKVTILFTLLRHGTVIVFLHAYPSLNVFLFATFTMTMVETIFRRHIALQLTSKVRIQITVARLKQLYLLSLGPALTIIIGMLTTQLDKVLAAAILTPEDYGRYALASILAQGCIAATQPFIQAISPKILQDRGPSPGKSLASRKLFRYLLLINFMILISYWMYGREIIELWLQSPAVAENTQLYFNVLIWGAVLNSLYHVSYFNLLSEEKFKKIFWINIIGLVASTISTLIFVRVFGVHWIGLAFVIPNVIAILATRFRIFSTK